MKLVVFSRYRRDTRPINQNKGAIKLVKAPKIEFFL